MVASALKPVVAPIIPPVAIPTETVVSSQSPAVISGDDNKKYIFGAIVVCVIAIVVIYIATRPATTIAATTTKPPLAKSGTTTVKPVGNTLGIGSGSTSTVAGTTAPTATTAPVVNTGNIGSIATASPTIKTYPGCVTRLDSDVIYTIFSISDQAFLSVVTTDIGANVHVLEDKKAIGAHWKIIHGPKNTIEFAPAYNNNLRLSLMSNASGLFGNSTVGPNDMSSWCRIDDTNHSLSGGSIQRFSPTESTGAFTFRTSDGLFIRTARSKHTCYMSGCQSARNCEIGYLATSHRDHQNPICFYGKEDHQECCTKEWPTLAVALKPTTDKTQEDTKFYEIRAGNWVFSAIDSTTPEKTIGVPFSACAIQ